MKITGIKDDQNEKQQHKNFYKFLQNNNKVNFQT